MWHFAHNKVDQKCFRPHTKNVMKETKNREERNNNKTKRKAHVKKKKRCELTELNYVQSYAKEKS